MPKLKRIVGICAEGRHLRLAVVCRGGEQCRVESVETIALRDPLQGSTERASAVPQSISEDPFGIHHFLEGKSSLPVHRTNPEILLGIFERYAAIADGYAVGGDPNLASLAVFQEARPPSKKAEWIARGRRQGLSLSGFETPRCFASNPGTQWVLFHSPSFPLLDLFRGANNLVGKYGSRIRLIEDPRVSLIEAARLRNSVGLDENIIILHREVLWGCLIGLRGERLLALSPLSLTQWQEDLKTWLIREVSPDKATIFLFSGAFTLGEIQPLISERYPTARIEPLIPLNSDAAASDEALPSYAIPIALAAKALSPRDPRFYPPLTLPRVVGHRRFRFKPSLARIAIVGATLLLGGNLTLQHIHHSEALRQLYLDLDPLEVVTDAQMKAQPFYASLEREVQAGGNRQTVLDSLSSSARPIGPFLDALCGQAAHRGGFWLNEFDFSSNGVTVSGTALKREYIDEAIRVLPGALLVSVTTHEIGRQTVYPFSMTVPAKSMAVRP